ncbi:hypothetical protein NMG60_11024083 [Bertholletia excelsa]
MAVDLWWESPCVGTSSPRISFSHDLVHGEGGVDDVSVAGSKVHEEPCGRSGSYSNSSHHEDEEFKFSIGNGNSSQSALKEPCSADELFAGGIIRPLQQIQPPPRPASSSSSSPSPSSYSSSSSSSTPPITNISHPPLPLPTSSSASVTAICNRINSNNSGVEAPKSSLWGIKRSSSSHHRNTSTCKKISSFWSLPLLQRSRSTGSLPKDYYRNNNHKQQHYNLYAPPSSSSSSPATASFRMYYYSLSEKPPVKDYGATWAKSYAPRC